MSLVLGSENHSENRDGGSLWQTEYPGSVRPTGHSQSIPRNTVTAAPTDPEYPKGLWR